VQVAQHSKQHLNLEPVILAGPADDTTSFSSFHVYRNAPLKEVKGVVAGAQLFVGNDSGPAHIAAAFGIPVVVLFGASNPVTWAPWRTEAEVITESSGMASVEVARVIAAVGKLRVRV
jgi:ADP-heptose:LPS heptosyltransferase